MNYKKVILIGLIISELMAGGYIVVKQYKKFGQILASKKPQIAALHKDAFFYPNETFKYFYEPRYGAPEIDFKPDWLPSKNTYAINSDTLHEAREYSIKKPSKIFRIIALGDSFTFGLFVNTQFNWTEQLEHILNLIQPCKQYESYEVINLGVIGYDIQYAAERYRRRGIKYGPDLVIWLLNNNDFNEIEEDMKTYEHAQYDIYAADNPTTDFTQWRIQHIGESKKNLMTTNGEVAIVARNVTYLKSISAYFQGPLVMAYVPFDSDIFEQQLHKFVLERPNTSQAPIRDIYNDINNAWFKPYDFHPNKEGHAIIAEDIYTHLSTTGLLCER